MTTSWDCFDTLIGRHYFNPKSIFHIVANKINDPSFVSKRIKAEKKSFKKNYYDIYKYLPKYDPNIELETELEYSFPIKNNFDAVKDNDIIVSDMYLDSKQIEKILRYHGLTKDIKIYSSYGGKRKGWIWKDIKNKHDIDYHIGDNIESDVIQARNNGINGIFFPGRYFTRTEEIIKKHSEDLSYFVRMIRLLNPYQQNRNHWIHTHGSFFNLCGSEWIEEINGKINSFSLKGHSKEYIVINRSNNVNVKLFATQSSLNNNSLYEGVWYNYNQDLTERNDGKLLWNDQAQYNVPALINICKLLPKNEKLIFCNRDCFYLNKIYNSMYNTNYEMLDVARHSYRYPYNEEYKKYILNKSNNCIIIDGHGSGQSASLFFNKYDIKKKLIHICLHNAKKNKKNKIFYGYLTYCDKDSCIGRAYEKFNTPKIGKLIGFKDNISIRSECEHDIYICDVQESCVDIACKYLTYYPNIIQDQRLLDILLNLMKNSYTDMIVKSIIK